MINKMLNYEAKRRQITLDGFFFHIDVIKMTDASESRPFIHDIRALLENYYGSNAYSFNMQYYYFAVVDTFGDEMIQQLSVALFTVTLVVLLITLNIRVTVFIVFVVLLVVLYMGGTMYFWDLTFNNISGINMILALGIAIDYSVHIAQRYLVIKPTLAHKTKSEQRDYKAK